MLLVAALVIVAILLVLYMLFGAQALGLPTLVGALVVLAAISAIHSFAVVLGVLGGLLLLFIAIGMAMTLGAGRPPQAHDERPKEE